MGHSDVIRTTNASIAGSEQTATCGITGDGLYEVAVVGPTGDYSWGFWVDKEIAQFECDKLNRMFGCTNADILAMDDRDQKKRATKAAQEEAAMPYYEVSEDDRS